MDAIIEAAIIVYRASLNQTKVIDFDDMILFPLVTNIAVRFPKDVVFVDEAQDLSKTRQALVRKFVKRNGRMIIVGDDRQAIYGFSGADASALDNLIRDTNAVSLPLSVTWRCPVAVVREAKKYVADIEAAPNAKEGSVQYATTIPTKLIPGQDAVLCRNMAPLIKVAYQLLRNGVAAKVEGRDVGEGLKTLCRRWKVKTVSALLTRLDDYQARETQKYAAKGEASKVEAVEDKCGALREIADKMLLEGKQDVADVIAFIDALFADGATNVVTLATYHRSKGREWNRVFLFEHSTRCPSRAAKKEWEMGQENNLAYVAITRAQDTLVFVGE